MDQGSAELDSSDKSHWLDSLDVAASAKIFAYLDLPDILSISTTCSTWASIVYVLFSSAQTLFGASEPLPLGDPWYLAF